MQKIHRLPPHEAQKIAAGEVVERPANAVKELLENAIDAGASKISLYIEQGGKKLIRVVDDGCGMNEMDAKMCFEHHATSKIKTVHDLTSISTFGFRGEALSSIAAVSKVTLITKEAQVLEAVKVELDAGKILAEEAVSANTGTDITIRDLFYNVPARQKFLKAHETEQRHIQQLFYALCFDYLNIHFKLYSENAVLYNCPPVQNLQDRVAQLLDPSVAQNMILIEPIKHAEITLHGVVSNHHFMRYDRSSIYFFVNSRWVKHQKLVSALLKGYLNVLPSGRFPAACIFITLDPSQVDINIHPRKEEVQFLHPIKIEQFLQKTVREALEKNLSAQIKKPVTFAPAIEILSSVQRHPTFNHLQFSPQFKPSPTVDRVSKERHLGEPFNLEEIAFQSHHAASAAPPQTQENYVELFKEQLFSEPNELIEDRSLQATAAASDMQEQDYQQNTYNIIGQYHKTYILLETQEGLVIIDQHAAHERVLYEQFSARFTEIATIKLLFPITITLTPEKLMILSTQLSLLKSNGIEADIFSDNQLIISSTPVHLKNQSLDDLIQSLIGWIIEYDALDKDQFCKAVNEKVHAMMACKAAVKAGDILTIEQMTQLLNDLYKTSNRFACPHGRPTLWHITLLELEKKFKRKV